MVLTDTTMSPPENEQTVAELLAGYAHTLAELRLRGVVRTNNAPSGDYAEWLTARGLGGVLVENFSVKSRDITLISEERVQVKARVVSAPRKSGQLQTSPFRSWNFDLAAFVLLQDNNYQVLQVMALSGAQHHRPELPPLRAMPRVSF